MIGHSIGEYVAACLAGVLSLEDALAVVAVRGRLMGQLPPGAMLAVSLSEVEVQPLIAGGLSLAAVNGPALCVLSGPIGEIQVLEAQLAKRAVHARRLHTSHAFHSAMMDAVVGPFVQELQAVALQRPQIPFLSNVTGTWITEDAATNPSYWGRQLRQPVRFADGVQELARAADWIVVEVGPGQTLSALARQSSGRAAEQIFLPAMRSAQDPQSDVTVMLGSLARLWAAGATVNWTGFSKHERRRRVSLPSYPFQKEHYWMGLAEQPSGTVSLEGEPDQQRNVGDWFYVPSWKPALQEPRRAATGEHKPARWLVFGTGGEFDSRLGERLAEKGDVVTTVVAGDQFVRVDPAHLPAATTASNRLRRARKGAPRRRARSRQDRARLERGPASRPLTMPTASTAHSLLVSTVSSSWHKRSSGRTSPNRLRLLPSRAVCTPSLATNRSRRPTRRSSGRAE